jgi:hypothetical protein
VEGRVGLGEPDAQLLEAAAQPAERDAGAGEVAEGFGGGRLAEVEVPHAVARLRGSNKAGLYQARTRPGATPRTSQSVAVV